MNFVQFLWNRKWERNRGHDELRDKNVVHTESLIEASRTPRARPCPRPQTTLFYGSVFRWTRLLKRSHHHNERFNIYKSLIGLG